MPSPFFSRSLLTMCANPVMEHFESTMPAAPVVIYTAKKVVTMERGNPEATAVVVSGKQIVLAGSLEEIKQFLGDKPYLVDDTFASKVIMPGFIDQHLHPLLGALTLATLPVFHPASVAPASGSGLEPVGHSGELRSSCAGVVPMMDRTSRVRWGWSA